MNTGGRGFFKPTRWKLIPTICLSAIYLLLILLSFIPFFMRAAGPTMFVMTLLPWILFGLLQQLAGINHRMGGEYFGIIFVVVPFVFWIVLGYVISCIGVFLTQKKIFSKMPFRIIGIIILTFIGISILFIPHWASYSVQSEDYCDNQARIIAGKDGNKEINATEEEKTRTPAMLVNGKISVTLHEMLKCESEQDKKFKYFIFF